MTTTRRSRQSQPQEQRIPPSGVVQPPPDVPPAGDPHPPSPSPIPDLAPRMVEIPEDRYKSMERQIADLTQTLLAVERHVSRGRIQLHSSPAESQRPIRPVHSSAPKIHHHGEVGAETLHLEVQIQFARGVDDALRPGILGEGGGALLLIVPNLLNHAGEDMDPDLSPPRTFPRTVPETYILLPSSWGSFPGAGSS
ncbi:hypothetical protein J5N97_007940 [Dioscorea zingiberensis]|uniref:Uncharacterized protein n=1 Tax=Dioscorea zingiberensis TaxID=325984 RepID=A0A9D5HUS1_9LILI|nr:hypothetical protein J5N97_007940 [Dioscorea zingiberensis]